MLVVLVLEAPTRGHRMSRQLPGSAGARILVVEDGNGLARLVQRKLRRHSFSVELAASADEARGAFDRLRPDLVVLDLDVGGACGRDFLADIRARPGTPVVALSSLRAERNVVATLDMGADDYLTKPVGLDELVARVLLGLRHIARPQAGAEPILHVGKLEHDLERRLVLQDAHPVHVTPTEYELLKIFATHPDRFLSDRYLIDAIWGARRTGGVATTSCTSTSLGSARRSRMNRRRLAIY